MDSSFPIRTSGMTNPSTGWLLKLVCVNISRGSVLQERVAFLRSVCLNGWIAQSTGIIMAAIFSGLCVTTKLNGVWFVAAIAMVLYLDNGRRAEKPAAISNLAVEHSAIPSNRIAILLRFPAIAALRTRSCQRVGGGHGTV
jgi:hypothetical protein